MKAYSLDLREKVLRAVDQGQSRREMVNMFGVSLATLKRYLKQRRETGNVLPKPIPGRPSKKLAPLAAGYFSRNVRAFEVLIDRNAITNGTAASGSPWRYYDLGHGWCSYEFFDQCPHRMACVRCDFYVPKDSTRGQWLETRDGLLKLLQEIPLSDEERAAVDGDVEVLNRLLERLKEVPPPSKTPQKTPQQSIIAVEQVRRFQAHRDEKERVR